MAFQSKATFANMMGRQPAVQLKRLAGVVLTTGRMEKTVKVRVMKWKWDEHLKKNYAHPYNVLVSDPTSALVEGDVVTLAREPRSKLVQHVVDSVLAPFGKPLSERPPILTAEERLLAYCEKRIHKIGSRIERWKDYLRQQDEARVLPVDMANITALAEGKVLDGQKAPVKVIENGKEGYKPGQHKMGKINPELIETRRKIIEMYKKAAPEAEKLEEVKDRPDAKYMKAATNIR